MAQKRKTEQTDQRAQPDPKIVALLRPSIPKWLDELSAEKTFACELDLLASEFRVFCHVARRESGKKGRGCCDESIPNMAKVCRLSENTIRASLRKLISLGLVIKKARPFKKKYRTNLYWIVPKSKDWTKTGSSDPF